MRFVEKTVAGIDITQERISIALLKQGKNGPTLIKSASAAVPAGAIQNGNIADAGLLAKIIRELKVRGRIWTNRAAVSLFARPVILQMIEMPKQMPANLTQFVRGEMKHCAAFPGGDIVLDYCSLGGNRRSAEKKVLAFSAETGKVTELLNVLNRAGFSAELIEPAILSYLRAIADKKITGRTGFNVLVAVLRENTLTLCVLRNGTIDFIRTKEAKQKSTACEEIFKWLGDEITEIQKFYSVEFIENTGKWDITIFTDTVLPENADTVLKSKFQTGSLQVRSSNDAYLDTIVDNQKLSHKNEQPSAVAVGLAMHLLTQQHEDVRLNLMPPQIIQIKEIKREALIAANIFAVLLLLIIIAVDVPSYFSENITRTAAAKTSLFSIEDTDFIIEKNQQLDQRLQSLSNRIAGISHISSLHNDVNWTELFDSIRKAAPASVRINSLFSTDGSRMHIYGLALSNDAVNTFVNSLEKAPQITSVSLLETSKQEGDKGYIRYQIGCRLAVKKGKG